MLKTTTLGRTGLKVSNICFGTSGIADMVAVYGYEVDAERAHGDGPRHLRRPDELPRHVPASTATAGARSGSATVIREMGGLPAGFVLSTKLDRDPETGRFDAAAARRSLETSLKALGLDRFDILHLHDPESSSR